MDLTFSTNHEIYDLTIAPEPRERYLRRLNIFTFQASNIDVGLRLFIDGNKSMDIDAMLYERIGNQFVYVYYFGDYVIPAEQSISLRLHQRGQNHIASVTCTVENHPMSDRIIQVPDRTPVTNRPVGEMYWMWAMKEETRTKIQLFDGRIAVATDSATANLFPPSITVGPVTWERINQPISIQYGDLAHIYRVAPSSRYVDVTTESIKSLDPFYSNQGALNHVVLHKAMMLVLA